MPKSNRKSTARKSTAVAAAKHSRTLRAVVAKPSGDAERKIERSKANAKQTAQIGVIAYIMRQLTEAKTARKPRTFAEMHENMQRYFPQRKASGLAITLRAQLSRLPNEKDFAISKNKSGRVTLYSAA